MVYNTCKQTYHRNKQFTACAKEQGANRARRPKRNIRESLSKLKTF